MHIATGFKYETHISTHNNARLPGIGNLLLYTVSQILKKFLDFAQN